MKLVPALAAATLLSASPALADRDAEPSGLSGSSGQAFRDRCAPGEALIGIVANVDIYEMTAVAGICARPISDGAVDPASIRNLPVMHGAVEGRLRSLRCAVPTPVVRSLSLSIRGAQMILRCFSARKGPLFAGGPFVSTGWSGAGDGTPRHLGPSTCGEDEMAVGFYGRHDFRVWQIGLICDTAPGYNLPVSQDAGSLNRPRPSQPGQIIRTRPNRPQR